MQQTGTTSTLPSGADAAVGQDTPLYDRRILFVMGSYPGKRPMYERARALGVKMVVLDGPGHWTQQATQDSLFEEFIEVDLRPSDSLADRAYRAIQVTGMQFDGIATFEEFAGPLTALLAQGLGLKGHPVLSVAFARENIWTREVCGEAGLPMPRFARIRSAADLERAASEVGFPAVLKPVSGASSFAAYRVEDLGRLRGRYSQTIAAADGRLKTAGVHSDDEQELVWANGMDMTLEEYLDGEEFDVDCLLSQGELVYSSVTRDLPQPYLREVGSQTPPMFPEEGQAELTEHAFEVLRVLGFTDGAFHVEMKYTSQGPRLIEVNARIGGGPIHRLNRMVWGVDLVEQYLMSCLDIPIRPVKAAEPRVCLITSDLPCPTSGIISRADFLSWVAEDRRVIHHETHVSVGQRVNGPDRGVPDSLGELIVQGATVPEAQQALEEILARVELPIRLEDAPEPEEAATGPGRSAG